MNFSSDNIIYDDYDSSKNFTVSESYLDESTKQIPSSFNMRQQINVKNILLYK